MMMPKLSKCQMHWAWGSLLWRNWKKWPSSYRVVVGGSLTFCSTWHLRVGSAGCIECTRHLRPKNSRFHKLTMVRHYPASYPQKIKPMLPFLLGMLPWQIILAELKVCKVRIGSDPKLHLILKSFMKWHRIYFKLPKNFPHILIS